MSMQSESTGEEEEEELYQEDLEPPYHPPAPLDELFDVSTTVDPSYIISLIRKLLPPGVSNCKKSPGADACNASAQGLENNRSEENAVFSSENRILSAKGGEMEAVENVDSFGEVSACEEGDNGSFNKQGGIVGEEAWEEYGCILWDLAANRVHAEFMVQNLVLEVLLASLMVSQSVRVKEISLGIIGNLACHDASRKQIVSKNGLIEIIVGQLFLDDIPCLCEACRLLMFGLQGSECVAWAEALQSEHILGRILWIAENTLNLKLIEKSVGLLLAILESDQKVTAALLPPLMTLGLPNILFNLLAAEMSKLTGERIPERYSLLDLILRTIEALSIIDDYSQEISSNKELFQLLYELFKLPDKTEVANSCVTSAVLVANILTDGAELALEISQDSSFLEGLLDILPFASDDIEAQSALWSIIARLLAQVQESGLSSSSLHRYVSVLASKLDLIEEALFDNQLNDLKEVNDSLTTGAKVDARNTALRRIMSVLDQWTTLEDSIKESNFHGENVDRLLEYCRKYIDSTAGSGSMD